MKLEHWLIALATAHPYFVYGTIVILACAEGPILSILSGILLRLGYFSLIPLYGALMAGDLIGDVIWYWIGARFGHHFIKRAGKYFGITEEAEVKVERFFHRFHARILFISKISNGFGFALVTLMTAGLVKIPFGTYMAVNLAGQFIWSGILIAFGYFVIHSYLAVSTWFSRLSIIALALIVVVGFLRYQVYLRKKIESRS